MQEMRFPVPSDRTLTELGLFFALLGIAGIGVPMIWPDQKIVGILFFVVGVVGCIGIVVFSVARLVYSKRVRLSTILMSLGTVLIIVGAIVGLFGAFMVDKENTTLGNLVSPLNNTIAISCAWSMPPARYREDKTLHIVDFQGVPVTGIDFNRQSAGPMHFVRSSEPFRPSESYSNMWYRCDVANHGPQPVRGLWVKFPVAYNAVVPQENGTKSGEMIAAGFARGPMLDLAAGESDYFYFANASAAFVTVLPPTSATLQSMADNTEHEVKVIASSNWQVGLLPSSKPLNAPVDKISPQ